VLGQHRSTQRYGYRMVCGRLRLDGCRVNHKRVHRLCGRDGLRVPRKNRRNRRLGVSANGIERRKAMHQNDVWCWDFVEDSDFLGRPLRFLTLVDEYTRDHLLLEVERSMTGERIRDLIAKVFRVRGAPRQNGYGESFNGRHRDELLNPRIVRDLRRPPRGEGARGALAARVQRREAAQLARARCPGPLRGAAASEETVHTMEPTRLSWCWTRDRGQVNPAEAGAGSALVRELVPWTTCWTRDDDNGGSNA
jgi:transposase InsO family protein